MKKLGLYFVVALVASYVHAEMVHTLYGSYDITEPLLVELMHSQAMQRLKEINQYGITSFVHPEYEYTRYQHSVGVMVLLRRFGASVEEQAMGLLHDVSHTAFSHVADYVFNTMLNNESYQDVILEAYIKSSDIMPILQKYGMADSVDDPDLKNYPMLKRNLPQLCADRLEYNLYGGYLEGWLTRDDVAYIVDHMAYTDNQWVFVQAYAARMFADVTVRLSDYHWCSAWNCFVYTEAANALKRAVTIDLFSMDDIIHKTDAPLWHILCASDDAEIQTYVQRIMHYADSFVLGDKDTHDYYVRGKFRGVDPLVQTDNGLFWLSDIDAAFKEYFTETQQQLKHGWYIRYVL